MTHRAKGMEQHSRCPTPADCECACPACLNARANFIERQKYGGKKRPEVSWVDEKAYHELERRFEAARLERDKLLDFVLWLSPCGQTEPPPTYKLIGEKARELLKRREA